MTGTSASACSATTTPCPTSTRSPKTCSGPSPPSPAPPASAPAAPAPPLGAASGVPPRGPRRTARARLASAPAPADPRARPRHPPSRRSPSVRLALCQLNATVGDITGNAELIRAGIRSARAQDAELVLFPELALTGYPPEDLLLKEHFLADARAALAGLAAEAEGIVAVVGFPERAEDVFNSAAVLAAGSVHAIYRKVYLPNYGVFDEQRYFQAARTGAVLDIGAERIGLTVCEDIWEPGPPASEESLAGATLIVNISASPYHAGKGSERELMFAQRARDNLACVAFCGLVGGQDELVFDGHSCVIDHTGRTIARAAQFREQLLVCEVDLGAAAAARLRDPSHRPAARRSERRASVLPALAAGPAAAEGLAGAAGDGEAGGGEAPLRPLSEPLRPVEAEVYAALCLGLRDYVEKNGFASVVLGLSGG